MLNFRLFSCLLGFKSYLVGRYIFTYILPLSCASCILSARWTIKNDCSQTCSYTGTTLPSWHLHVFIPIPAITIVWQLDWSPKFHVKTYHTQLFEIVVYFQSGVVAWCFAVGCFEFITHWHNWQGYVMLLCIIFCTSQVNNMYTHYLQSVCSCVTVSAIAVLLNLLISYFLHFGP
jgi:hypothetical protein